MKRVRDGDVDCAFEGVVGKAGDGHKIVRAKAKTQAWVDKVKEVYGEIAAEKILNS